jgi:hypothetical protein
MTVEQMRHLLEGVSGDTEILINGVMVQIDTFGLDTIPAVGRLAEVVPTGTGYMTIEELDRRLRYYAANDIPNSLMDLLEQNTKTVLIIG